MFDNLAVAESEQILEAGVDADDAFCRASYSLRLGINEQAQMPTDARLTRRPHLILPSGMSIP